MERKDYYKILGLSDSDKKLQGDEFKKKVKQNYKKNALKYHQIDNMENQMKKKRLLKKSLKNLQKPMRFYLTTQREVNMTTQWVV